MNQTKRWMKLDNAAKIYPAARRRNWSNVFRLSASLNEPVDPEILQSALEVTARRFPSISVRLSFGMFWYYLEETADIPRIQPDKPYPCTRMKLGEIRKCAFRVLYYENRIAVEFFHALTDGNGGLIFLKTLTAEYLSQKYGIKIPNSNGVLDRFREATPEELEDSFLKYEGEVSRSRNEEKAYCIRGTKEEDGRLNIITGIIDAEKLHAEAKSYGVSITAYIASVIIMTIAGIQSENVPDVRKRKAVKVLIPVNLRHFFDSSSLRNFVLYITPGINPRMGDFTFEEVLKTVHHQMGFELTKKQMNARITANVRSEKNPVLKIMPLFIKNIGMKVVYNAVGEKTSSITLSNLGNVSLPEEMTGYVKHMDFILGDQLVLPGNCAMLSYGGKLYINFTRNIQEPELEKRFFIFLRQRGIIARIESNQE